MGAIEDRLGYLEREERDRYKEERDQFLLKLAEILDEEEIGDAEQISSSRPFRESQGG